MGDSSAGTRVEHRFKELRVQTGQNEIDGEMPLQTYHMSHVGTFLVQLLG